MNKRLEDDYVKELELLHNSLDEEKAYDKADELLCEFLNKLGYTNIVKAFDKVPKYYA